jgi:hypothetical protein
VATKYVHCQFLHAYSSVWAKGSIVMSAGSTDSTTGEKKSKNTSLYLQRGCAEPTEGASKEKPVNNAYDSSRSVMAHYNDW